MTGNEDDRMCLQKGDPPCTDPNSEANSGRHSPCTLHYAGHTDFQFWTLHADVRRTRLLRGQDNPSRKRHLREEAKAPGRGRAGSLSLEIYKVTMPLLLMLVSTF